MVTGYMGKILMVNLTDGTIEEQKIPDAVYEKYLSGSGLGGFILFNNISEGADPLGPDNMLGFVSGLLTGTGSLFTGRWMAVGKSPLTGGYGEANCGGNFSPAIKRCGYDGIFFKGISNKPSPRALGQPSQSEGANKNRTVDIDRMLEDYWRQFNWDAQTGKPREEVTTLTNQL